MSNLTPCRFFAQGSCRYGNNCRFYHEPRGQTTGQVQPGIFGNKTLAPATFQPQGGVNQGVLNLTAKSVQNLDIIVEAVKKDMQEWQICKIWPYSCYGPVGGKPCVPGFEDLSPEEVRLAFMQNGNYMPPDMTQRFQLIQQFRLNYQQPTIENRSIIERIATTNTPTSPFGGQPTNPHQQSSIFGGAAGSGQVTQPGSIFGGQFQSQQQQPSTTGLFSQGQNSFGTGTATANNFGSNPFQTQTASQGTTTTQGSMFGAPQTQSQTQVGIGGFSQPQSGGLFQQTQNQSSLFQTPQLPQTQSQNIFQQQTNQVQGNAFQQQPQTVNPLQPQGTGLFQQPQQPVVSSNIFQQPQLQSQQQQQPQPGTLAFNTNQQQGLIFVPPNSSIFGNNAAQPNIGLGGGAVAGNIFGGSGVSGNAQQQQAGSIVGSSGGATAQKFVYSEEADLLPEELAAFQAVEFTSDSLPVRPPPRSLCT